MTTSTQSLRPSSAAELATNAENYKTSFVGVQLAMVALMHPAGFMERVMDEITPELSTSPLTVVRADGSTASSENINYWLQQARKDNGRGLGLGGDVLPFTAMFIVTRLADDLDQLGLRDSSSPVLEFLRHLRNAAAHGNRWHFVGQEPKFPAKLRSIELDSSMHGTTALYSGTVGPGDFFDLLDDVRDELRKRP
ncbi:hypothetical protein ACU18_03315 [Arthrobacter sp. ZBG10]|uniref:hypothetical protein n=1 Tax=Arthrobacter sp. ZBG10 TaxID=1676590 RepID=UPI000680BE47|nr:hypothetical protein [Arthrobacter sp. ZBG10]KNH21171.1 hypothetical protein ACU18_03315 [Arthrobacter sp. ZBG10]